MDVLEQQQQQRDEEQQELDQEKPRGPPYDEENFDDTADAKHVNVPKQILPDDKNSAQEQINTSAEQINTSTEQFHGNAADTEDSDSDVEHAALAPTSHEENASKLPADVASLTLGQMRKRALAAGATEDDIDDAMDAIDSRSALASVLLAAESRFMPSSAAVSSLSNTTEAPNADSAAAVTDSTHVESEEVEAAIKIQAIQRGRKSRRKVAKSTSPNHNTIQLYDNTSVEQQRQHLDHHLAQSQQSEPEPDPEPVPEPVLEPVPVPAPEPEPEPVPAVAQVQGQHEFPALSQSAPQPQPLQNQALRQHEELVSDHQSGQLGKQNDGPNFTPRDREYTQPYTSPTTNRQHWRPQASEPNQIVRPYYQAENLSTQYTHAASSSDPQHSSSAASYVANEPSTNMKQFSGTVAATISRRPSPVHQEKSAALGYRTVQPPAREYLRQTIGPTFQTALATLAAWRPDTNVDLAAALADVFERAADSKPVVQPNPPSSASMAVALLMGSGRRSSGGGLGSSSSHVELDVREQA
eukprot:SAG31_NODE_4221_length_3449_cov_1.824478_3_plen_526_part_01